jgi:hypothetical protein
MRAALQTGEAPPIAADVARGALDGVCGPVGRVAAPPERRTGGPTATESSAKNGGSGSPRSVLDRLQRQDTKLAAGAPPLPNPRRKEKVMRFILALLLMSGTAMAQVQNQTYQDAMGRNTGRSVTDSHGNTMFYDAMGRTTGRSVTDSKGNTTFYDAMGRQMGTIRGSR